jgi:hypothetical protein
MDTETWGQRGLFVCDLESEELDLTPQRVLVL